MAASRDGEDDADEGVSNPFEHAAYAPPWREALPSGELGPEYGPISYVTGVEVAPETAIKEHRESRDAIGGGGLVDHELARGSSTPLGDRWRARLERERRERWDRRQVMAYVNRHSARMAKRLLEVAILYWEHKVSGGQIALRLGVSKPRVWQLVQQMRALVKEARKEGAEDP